MDAVSWYVMSSSWGFLISWIVMLLVAGAAVFRGDRGES
jgi:biotin transporter BioY